MGGRSAGRSFVASQYALAHLRAPEYFRCAIMRFILTDVKKSIYQEIVDRVDENGINDVDVHNLGFTCGGNSINGLGFRKSTSDQKSKLKSLASYNCVIIEEADEVSEEDFQQLDDSIRTMKSDIKIVLLLNPPHKDHWIIKRWFNLVETDQDGFYIPELKKDVDDTTYIHTTYKDNITNINKSTLNNFAMYAERDPEHYRSMILGLVSEGRKGVIFQNWKPMSAAEYEELDHDVSYGLDFGFSNDPTTLIEVKKHKNKVYLKELIYETGLLDEDTSQKMSTLGVNRLSAIYSDRDPKTIAQLRKMGWNVKGAPKGKDSVKNGVSKLLEKDVYYVDTSLNIITEKENYVWKLDRDKRPTNEPVDKFNHAIDAIRYNIAGSEQDGNNFGFL